MKKYYDQLYAHKFGNVDKMDQLLARLLKLTQGETDYLNRPMLKQLNQ